MIVARRHEHFFSPLADRDLSKTSGRFDAVEDDEGQFHVWDAERLKWIEASSWDDARSKARQMAADWRPE